MLSIFHPLSDNFLASWILESCSLNLRCSPNLLPEIPSSPTPGLSGPVGHLLLEACLPLSAQLSCLSRHLTLAPYPQTCPAGAPAWLDMALAMTKNRSCIKERWDPNKVWSRKYNDPPKIWSWCFHRSPVPASKHVNYLYFAFKLSFGARFPS